MLFKFETPEHQQSAIQSVAKVLLYPSFRVGFNPTFLTLGRANVFVLHSLNRKVLLVLLLSPYGDSKMARNGFLDEPSGKAEREDGSKLYVSNSVELS